MKAAVLSIGNELLRGATLNTNLASIGSALQGQGIFPTVEMTVPDEEEALKSGLDFLLPSVDVLICTGGLGPTRDDITKRVIVDYLGLNLCRSEEVLGHLRKYWISRGRKGKMPEKVIEQADIPEAALVLPNLVGTAPGLAIEFKDPESGSPKSIVLLPGPPAECIPILRDSLLPYLSRRRDTYFHSVMLLTAGVPESIVEQKADPVLGRYPQTEAAFCASPAGVKIFLGGTDLETLKKCETGLREVFGEDMLPAEDNCLVRAVSRLLRERGEKLSLAESCTGGLLASIITSVPGASDVFPGGYVTYENKWKQRMLGVTRETLENHGAVSGECAREMVEGLCDRTGTAAGIAVTGIAGPSGGGPEKPAGLVFIASSYHGRALVKRHIFPGGRNLVRERTAYTALNQIRKQILFEKCP